MNKTKVWINIRDTFWFMPAAYSIVAIFTVLLINIADVWLVSAVKEDILKPLITDKDTAKKLYATLVTAILTMTTLSFSVIMVVLTTYASEFSPRALQNFMKDKVTQHVLGIYSLGFIFALLLLFLVDYGEPILRPLVMVIITIVNLGAFIYFTHHSARFLQVNNLIETMKNEGIKIVEELYKKQQSYRKYSTWNENEILEFKEVAKTIVKSKHSGYVQNIQWNAIVKWANKHNSLIELHVQPGSYIPKDLPIMTIWTDEKLKGDVHSFFVVGKERSDIQDFEFTIQKIEEIALRTIAPSANDPHTAINCINRIGILLIELGEFYEQTPYLADTQDHLRVIHEPKSFEDYLYKSFYQIRNYGQDRVSIIYSLLDVLYKIGAVSSPTIKQKVWQFHFYIMDVVKWDTLSDLDQAHLQEAYDRLENCCKE